jgi:hypothetical protein
MIDESSPEPLNIAHAAIECQLVAPVRKMLRSLRDDDFGVLVLVQTYDFSSFGTQGASGAVP